MTSVYGNVRVSDDDRRRALFEGALFLISPNAATAALGDLARSMLADAFAPYDPRTAQYEMSVEEWVARFAPVKPAFIHAPETKQLISDVYTSAGCDPDLTYLDVPRMRGVTSDGYLTSGVGYAHHPHRDTWYSAPMCQLNWWMPLYEFEASSGMAFLPRYWSEPVRNGSSRFNYYDWNARGRKEAAQHIKQDTRDQPKPEEEVDMSGDIRLVCPVDGIILFAGAQLHATVPNNTGVSRFSLDFRSVNLDDLVAGHGAPNVDSSPEGTSLRDFMRCSDLAPLPEDVVAAYDFGPVPDDATLVFRPEPSGATRG